MNKYECHAKFSLHVLIIHIPSFLVNRVHKKVTTDIRDNFSTTSIILTT